MRQLTHQDEDPDVVIPPSTPALTKLATPIAIRPEYIAHRMSTLKTRMFTSPLGPHLGNSSLVFFDSTGGEARKLSTTDYEMGLATYTQSFLVDGSSGQRFLHIRSPSLFHHAFDCMLPEQTTESGAGCGPFRRVC